MNEKPKVSVIIPSYNAKERLEGSLFLNASGNRYSI